MTLYLQINLYSNRIVFQELQEFFTCVAGLRGSSSRGRPGLLIYQVLSLRHVWTWPAPDLVSICMNCLGIFQHSGGSKRERDVPSGKLTRSLKNLTEMTLMWENPVYLYKETNASKCPSAGSFALQVTWEAMQTTVSQEADTAGWRHSKLLPFATNDSGLSPLINLNWPVKASLPTKGRFWCSQHHSKVGKFIRIQDSVRCPSGKGYWLTWHRGDWSLVQDSSECRASKVLSVESGHSTLPRPLCNSCIERSHNIQEVFLLFYLVFWMRQDLL